MIPLTFDLLCCCSNYITCYVTVAPMTRYDVTVIKKVYVKGESNKQPAAIIAIVAHE